MSFARVSSCVKEKIWIATKTTTVRVAMDETVHNNSPSHRLSRGDCGVSSEGKAEAECVIFFFI